MEFEVDENYPFVCHRQNSRVFLERYDTRDEFSREDHTVYDLSQ